MMDRKKTNKIAKTRSDFLRTCPGAIFILLFADLVSKRTLLPPLSPLLNKGVIFSFLFVDRANFLHIKLFFCLHLPILKLVANNKFYFIRNMEKFNSNSAFHNSELAPVVPIVSNSLFPNLGVVV